MLKHGQKINKNIRLCGSDDFSVWLGDRSAPGGTSCNLRRKPHARIDSGERNEVPFQGYEMGKPLERARRKASGLTAQSMGKIAGLHVPIRLPFGQTRPFQLLYFIKGNRLQMSRLPK